MLKPLLTAVFLLNAIASDTVSRLRVEYNHQDTGCTKKKDVLIGKIIYTSFDEPARNKGGEALLFRALAHVKLDSIPNGASTRFMIALVIDVDGGVIGARVVKDEVGNLGEQMIRIAKSFKWIPAICKGKKVASLRHISTQICLF